MSPDANKKKEAVRKTIAAMTVGKDASCLFMEMLHSINTNDLEVKKLVYLFLTNYAQAKQDLALLAVNAFVQDASHDNPLIRALSIRTMGSIRVNTLSEYLCEPLRSCLEDTDPYVRKTAALTVAKVYDISPELIEDQGFLETLANLLNDENHVVISNTATALAEIAASHPSPSSVFSLSYSVVMSLLTAMDSCTEWGQISLIDVIREYDPGSKEEAETLCERLMPRLQHRNSALVLGTVKLLLKYSKLLHRAEALNIERRITPPLISLMSATHEIQYIVLRCVLLIVSQNPLLLADHYKVFFCKYNDPIHVKLEKVEVLTLLSTDDNIAAILAEFSDYAKEVDVDFVRKSVRAIGLCAIKLRNCATFCVEALLSLMKTKIAHVVQEITVVMRDIFRRYPARYEACITELCSHLTSLDEPQAKSSMAWIVGEAAGKISNISDLMEMFIDGFNEEPSEVQLSILTATVKCFLRRPREIKPLLSRVLEFATNQSDNPDLRDRGFLYWRLLSLGPDVAKRAVLAERPEISDKVFYLEHELVQKLLLELGSLACLLHKDPILIAPKLLKAAEERKLMDQNEEGVTITGDLIGGDDMDEVSISKSGGDDILDLLSLDDKPTDLLGVVEEQQSKEEEKIDLPKVYSGEGIEVYGKFEKNNEGKTVLTMVVTNVGSLVVSNFLMQFNVNVLGLAVDPSFKISNISPRSRESVSVLIGHNSQRKKLNEQTIKNSKILQVAIKFSDKGPFFLI
ncbi:hypothetical protein GEMRC1_008053 [Eukaryota sp. GEM-RC1]